MGRWAFLDPAVVQLNDGRLTDVAAAEPKWWLSDLQQRVVEIQPIYGGTNEIMKEIIGRSLAES